MKTSNIKQKIEQLGFKVKISHARKLNSESPVKPGECVNAAHIRGLGMSKFISGKGGITSVKLIRGKDISSGQAECSDNDSYNKTEGFKIALGRALAGFDYSKELIKELVE